MVDSAHGGTKLWSLSSGPGPSQLPAAPAQTTTSAATAAAGNLPPHSQSYYETWSEACSTTACSTCNVSSSCQDLVSEGAFATPYGLQVIQIGSACGTQSVQTYGGGCLNQQQLLYEIAGWAFGFIANVSHANQWTALVAAMNNSGDLDPSTEYLNGANYYVNFTTWLTDYVVLLNAINSNHATVWVAGGDDVETALPFLPPTPSLNWLQGFSTEQYFQSFNGWAQYQLLDDGDSTNTCALASCFYDPTYGGDPQGWTPDDVWLANWGYPIDQGSPQVYNSNRGAVYGALDAAAAAANPLTAKGSPVPTWEQVMYGCPGSIGNETSATQSYLDFQSGTGQSPPYLTDFHILGDQSVATCGGG